MMTSGDRTPLIDVHAHFFTPYCNRADWQEYNAARLAAGDRIGVSCHVASVLGSWGFSSPTYFASPSDQSRANDWMFEFAEREFPRVRAYVAVNPNFTSHALKEIERGIVRGAVGIKLAAGRRADDVLLDEIVQCATEGHSGRSLPVLHHVWQHRRRDWPAQDASDGVELGRLASRHPGVSFILAHIGGGGDWAHTPPAVQEIANVFVDLSGSGIDRGMLDCAIDWLGCRRLLWAADLTLCTGLTKLRALEHTGISLDDIADICWRNAVRIFPEDAFTAIRGAGGKTGSASETTIDATTGTGE